MAIQTPHYPLRTVKAMIKSGDYLIRPNALHDAMWFFNWGPTEIEKCILKFNSRYHNNDRQNNHFYKHEPHRGFPHTVMDYYKAMNIMQGFSVYTHFYVHPTTQKLTISSFKEL